MAKESVATTPRIEDAQDALFHAKSIVDILSDSPQVDKNSAAVGALSAVLDLIHQAQRALDGGARA